SLMATGVQASVVSRNVAGANQVGFSRKIAELNTWPGNGVYVASIQRAADAGLFSNVLTASAASARPDELYNGLHKIAGATIDDPQLDQSPTGQLAKLKQALQQYATSPDNVTLAKAAVTAAKDMATALNGATNTVQQVRATADADIAASVGKINQL